MHSRKTEELLDRYLQGQCSAEEEQQVEQWLDQYEQPSAEWQQMNDKEKARWIRNLYAEIQDAAGITAPRTVRMFTLRRVAAAIAILLVLGVALMFTLQQTQPGNKQTAVNQSSKDLAPGFDGAVLTTTTGQKIILDSAANGIISNEGNASVNKNGSQLVYDVSNSPLTTDHSPVLNTLTTPRGRKFELVLADGTKVWLDAASSITYPASFTGKERKVEVTGQIYFEVAKNAAMPFIVKKGEAEVTVLGTHFNVNAYEDEGDIKVTLLEGSVKVNNDVDSKTIKPGEQAVAVSHSPFTIHHSPDLDEVMAWKNGRFQFASADLQTILRQAARWYDVDVEYRGNVKEKFSGGISRNVNASQLFTILESTDKIKITIDQGKIIVEPK